MSVQPAIPGCSGAAVHAIGLSLSPGLFLPGKEQRKRDHEDHGGQCYDSEREELLRGHSVSFLLP